MSWRIWDGVPLGFQDGKPLSNPGPAPTCILGEPGSGKTTDVTCNYLLDEMGKESFILLDSKNTGCAITYDWRVKVCGADNVKRINPENLLDLGSDGWNPVKIDLTSPDYEDQALTRARGLVPETNEKQPHFTLGTRALVAAAIIDENRQAAKEGREPDFARGVRSPFLADKKKIAATLKRMMESGDPAIIDRVSRLLSETDETDSLKSTLEAVTGWATASMRADMNKAHGVDFVACRKKPTTIYASLSTKSLIDKGTYFRVLVKSAADMLLSVPGIKTTIIIEEGFALGRLEVLDRLYAVAREHSIEIVIVFQRLSQIKQLYPNTWQQFVSGALLAYQPGERETAEFLSWRAGEEWVPVLSVQEPGINELGPRASWSPQKRLRFPPGKLFAMPPGVALAWLPKPGDDAPRIVTMRGYYHRDLRELGRRAKPNPYFTGSATRSAPRRKWVRAVGVLFAAAALLRPVSVADGNAAGMSMHNRAETAGIHAASRPEQSSARRAVVSTNRGPR